MRDSPSAAAQEECAQDTRHRARADEACRGAAARARPHDDLRTDHRRPRHLDRRFAFSSPGDVAAHAVTNSTNRDTKYAKTSRPRNEPKTAPLGEFVTLPGRWS